MSLGAVAVRILDAFAGKPVCKAPGFQCPNRPAENLSELLLQSAERFGRRVALQIRDQGESEGWRRLSRRQILADSENLARALKARGVSPGDSVALLSENRPEWAVAFFGILRLGAVVVPVDKFLKKDEVAGVLKNSDSKLVIASEKYLDVIREIPGRPPVISLDNVEAPGVSSWLRELLRGRRLPPVEKNPSTRDSTAVMIFTSGTTGNPKGVMLTHGNLLSNGEAFSEMFPPRFLKSNFLSILPLNHAFELNGGFLTPLRGGGTVTYQESIRPEDMLRNMRETKTQTMLVVPVVLERLRDRITEEAGRSPKTRKKFELGLKLSSFLPFKARRWIFRQVHAAFGKKLQYFISGGAPLSPELQGTFEKLGFHVIQGYGLTETSPALTVNPLRKAKKGSAGKPVPGVEITISQNDGEILVRGPNVMKGYYKNPEATREAMEGGYFHTGDIGAFDRDGYLYISGRKKNVIVTQNGKKVFAEEVEEKLKGAPYIKDVCVMGRRSGVAEEVVAVVVPDRERMRQEGMRDEEAKAAVWEGVKKVNQTMAHYKAVRDIILWERDFPRTASMKVKRGELARLLAEQEGA